MSKEITSPWVGDALGASFGLRGRVGVNLDETVVPVAIVSNDELASPPTLVRRAVNTAFEAAVVGEFFLARFELPAGTLGVIREMEFLNIGGTGGTIRFGFPGNAATIAAQANVASSSFTDGRLLPGSPGGAQLPAGVLTTDTSAVALATFSYGLRLPAAGAPGRLRIRPDWIIGTGTQQLVGFLEMGFSVANMGIGMSMIWDEHSLV